MSATSASTSRPPVASSPSSAIPDETEAASDEVKVFDDEDEREANSHQQVDILSAIKSSLITDTEQVGFPTNLCSYFERINVRSSLLLNKKY